MVDAIDIRAFSSENTQAMTVTLTEAERDLARLAVAHTYHLADRAPTRSEARGRLLSEAARLSAQAAGTPKDPVRG